MGTDTLNERQQTFVRLMATGVLSMTEAYVQSGYSHVSAGPNAHTLMKKQKIQEAIAERKAHLAATRAIPTSEQITAELWTIASAGKSESARVSALKVLADILGIANVGSLPQGLTVFLQSISTGDPVIQASDPVIALGSSDSSDSSDQ